MSKWLNMSPTGGCWRAEATGELTSDTHETFNHSEPYSRTREDSVLNEDLAIEKQDSFFRLLSYFLYNTLTISKLKIMSVLLWSVGGSGFSYRFTRLLVPYAQRWISYETLEGVESLARIVTALEDYLCDLWIRDIKTACQDLLFVQWQWQTDTDWWKAVSYPLVMVWYFSQPMAFHQRCEINLKMRSSQGLKWTESHRERW